MDMFVKRFLAGACLAMFSAPLSAQMHGFALCGFASMHCTCGALYAVIESDDPQETARYRALSEQIRQTSMIRLGSRLEASVHEAEVAFWRDLEPSVENNILFAETLAACSPFLTGRYRTEVLVTP